MRTGINHQPDRPRTNPRNNARTDRRGSQGDTAASDKSSRESEFWQSEGWHSGRWIHDAVTQPPLPSGPSTEADDELDSFGATEALIFPAPCDEHERQKDHFHHGAEAHPDYSGSPQSVPAYRTAGISLAAVAGLLGCIVLLYTFTAPLFTSHFVTQNLAPAILPWSAAELNAEDRTALSYDTISSDAGQMHADQIHAGQIHAGQIHAGEMDPQNSTSSDGERVQKARAMLAEVGSGDTVSAGEFARLMMAAESTEVAAALSHRKLGARVALSLMLVLAMAALIAGLMVLARRLGPLDRTQSVIHGAFGGLGLAVFGMLLTAILFDSTVATQLDLHGVSAGLLGATLLWGSSLSALRSPRDWILNPLLGVGLLAAIGLFVGLLITL